jgi:ribose transport system substrate-binding protein
MTPWRVVQTGGTSVTKRNFLPPAGRIRKGLLAALAIFSHAATTVCVIGTVNAATGPPAGIPKSKIKIALVSGGPNAYFAPWAAAAIAESRVLGVTVSYVVPPTATFEPSVEMSTIESLVAKGYNAFAIYPDGEASIVPLYNRLKARGIPVIDVAGCTTDPTPALLCFGTNVQASAKYATEVLTKAMGGKGNAALLTGLLTDANTALREDGVRAGVAETRGRVNLVQVVADIDSPSAAPPAVESLLASKGSNLTGMLSTDYYPSVAAASVLSSNAQFRHILFIGGDNDPTVMHALTRGYIYGTMWQNSYGQGVVAAQWLYKILADGCIVNRDAPFTKIGNTAHFIDSGYLFVDQNLAKQYSGGMESIPSITEKALGETQQILSCP